MWLVVIGLAIARFTQHIIPGKSTSIVGRFDGATSLQCRDGTWRLSRHPHKAGLGVAWSHWYMAGWHLVSSLDGCMTYWKWTISNLCDLFDWEPEQKANIHRDWYLSKASWAMGHPKHQCIIYCISPQILSFGRNTVFLQWCFCCLLSFLEWDAFYKRRIFVVWVPVRLPWEILLIFPVGEAGSHHCFLVTSYYNFELYCQEINTNYI